MPFYLTRPRTTTLIRQLHSVINEAEASMLLAHISTIPTKEGLLGSGNTNHDIRRSKVAWIIPTKETDWIYTKISQVIKQVNNESYNFDINLIQDMQYTEYHGDEQGTYHDHLDWGPGAFTARKLSLSLQLTDSNEYEGGDLEIKTTSEAPFKASRKIGDAVVFPSFLLHGVTPVTTGIRKSLVAWVQGPEWR